MFMKEEIKKQAQNRLRRIEGQVRGLHKMIDEEQYCVDIITQSTAIRNALSAVENLILENHLSTHVLHQMQSKNPNKAIDEILSVYKLAKRK